MDRRKLLKSLGISLAFTSSGLAHSAIPSLQKHSHSKKSLRIAHVTDIHVKPGLKAPKGLEKCLHHIQNLQEPIDMILNGGDSIMDALHTEKPKVHKQWNVWNDVLKSECSLKVYNCIGNHDIWGLGNKRDLLSGKNWAMEMMQLENRYYSFDYQGWHFIVLDSIHKKEDGTWYIAKLDEQQFKWLKKDLRQTPQSTPIMVLSHIPILSAAAFFDGENEKVNSWSIPASWIHIDARKIVQLFYKHKNVKLCVSGHLHLFDRVDYNGVTYICNGAVSGNWWWGSYHQTPAGYGIITLYENGTFDHEYVRYA